MDMQGRGNRNWQKLLKDFIIRLRGGKTVGAIANLEEAVRLVGDTLRAEFEADAVSGDHPDWEAWLDGPGINLIKKYGDVAIHDLEEVIRIERETAHATPRDHPERPIILEQLGSRLLCKYMRTGNLEDLNDGIRTTWEAVQLISRKGTTDKHLSILFSRKILEIANSSRLVTKLAYFMGGLVANLRDRYLRLRSTRDLEDAVKTARIAVDYSPSNPFLKGLLASSLVYQYSESGDLNSLNEAISLTLKITEEHPQNLNYGRWLSTLAIGFKYQYSRTKDISYLDRSMEAELKAIDATLSTTPARANHHVGLADMLYDRYIHTLSNEDLIKALSHYQAGLDQMNSPILTRIEASRAISNICTIISDWEWAYEALNMAVDLIPKLIIRSAEISDRQHILAEVTGLASTGAAAALQAGKDPLIALNLLNRGRGVLASSLEEMRVDVDLENVDAQLRERFDLLRNQLQVPIDNKTSASSVPEVFDISSWETEHISRLRMNDITAQARNRESAEVLEWLWDVVAAPVLNALGLVESVFDGPWPHIWWIPTGPLGKFPLHAAGYHRLRNGESVIDRAMSSYSSSIKAIIQGRQRDIPNDIEYHQSQALLVAMQDTPGLNGRLTCATEEVETVYELCLSMAINPTVVNNPSQSHLMLADWQDNPLTVSNLLNLNIRKNSPFLAYLSACGTGQVEDETWIDESIHLVSACQLAGFRHVIGTLWEVSDETCVEMARVVYEVIRNEGMTDDSVCKGLHLATRRLRDRWVSEENPKTEEERSINIESGTSIQEIELDDGDGRISQRQRDATLCEDEDASLLKWIPYVHFGL
ncbi:hypothetical protein F4774DRAFT_427186 [Daldinia eschscholtzii]|nr:hypothetical protein F4774DRAFT_427186 [Daldinia eschscholtzii]